MIGQYPAEKDRLLGPAVTGLAVVRLAVIGLELVRLAVIRSELVRLAVIGLAVIRWYRLVGRR